MRSEIARSRESLRIALLTPVRRHAALVRTLLDELERVAPAASERASDGGEQLVEELAHLGSRIFECLAAMRAARQP